MNNLVTGEEIKKCRNRVNPVKDATQLISKVGLADDYTCSETRKKKNDLVFDEEVKRLTGEVWDEL